MIIAGVDPSTNTGLAIIEFENGKPFELLSETIAVRGKKGIERAHLLSQMVTERLVNAEPDLVVFEGYGFNSRTLAISVEIGTLYRYACFTRHMAYIEVAPPTLKKFITGKGNAKKDQITLEVYKRWGITCDNDDIADAVGLAMVGGAVQKALKVNKVQEEIALAVLAKNV